MITSLAFCSERVGSAGGSIIGYCTKAGLWGAGGWESSGVSHKREALRKNSETCDAPAARNGLGVVYFQGRCPWLGLRCAFGA